MRTAVTVWKDVVSTVCDFSSRLLVFDVLEEEVKNRTFVPFETLMLPERVNQLERLGVEVLLCGAISRPLERMIRRSGIEVIPCLRGAVEEVIAAYLAGGLADARFILPGFGSGVGCVREGRRHRGGACRFRVPVKGGKGKAQGR